MSVGRKRAKAAGQLLDRVEALIEEARATFELLGDQDPTNGLDTFDEWTEWSSAHKRIPEQLSKLRADVQRFADHYRTADDTDAEERVYRRLTDRSADRG